MAARVLLLSILFTEVLKPVCVASVKGVGGRISGKDGSKPDGLDTDQSGGLEVTLETKPTGTVTLGKRGVTLSCSSGPNYEVSWSRNGKSVPPCGIARCTLLRDGSLHFYKKQNLQAQKPGEEGGNGTTSRPTRDEYHCIARSNLGGSIRSAPIYVQIAELSHAFKKSPEDLTVREDEIARLSCQIDSIPYPPNITWQHNGETISLDRNKAKYFMVSPGVLYISATKFSDAGTYRCTAANEFLKKTKKSKEAKLTVIARSAVSRVPDSGSHVSLFPQISYNHWLINGSNLNLTCAASGYPSPLVSWSFVPLNPGSNITKKPRFLINSADGISVLTLKNVNTSNAGSYLCSTKNSDNDDQQIQNVTVNVLIPPSFIKRPLNHVCPSGRTARFECQAQGLPTPQIYWLKDSTNISINGRRTTYEKDHNKMELAISATVPTDSGVYQCVAVNAAGQIWAAGRLQVNTSRNSPAVPTSLKCNSVSPNKMFISWEAPRSLPMGNITAYTVHYSPIEGGREEVTPPEAGNSTSVEVTKLLEPFTNYSFYVRVWSNQGASDPSATIVCSTAQSVPKDVPKITLDPMGSTKLNVSWEPLSEAKARGIVVGYKLQWRLHEHPSMNVLYPSANVRHYIVNGLTAGVRYDFRVLARTELGWPNINESQLGWTSVTMPSTSEPNQSTIMNAVDVQSIIANASVVKVTWKISDESRERIESQFDAWQISCEDRNGQTVDTVNLPKNATEYVFTGLDTNISYIVDLCAMNLDKAVSCLEKYIQSSQHGPSNIPTMLEAVPLSPNSINVSWKVRDKDEANSYEVCYRVFRKGSSEDSDCIETEDLNVTVGQLKPFTLYQFKVRVLRNDTNLSSSYSEIVECYTNEDVPDKVEDVVWLKGNGTKILISWKEPNKLNGIIQSYLITYTKDLTLTNLASVSVSGNRTSTYLPTLSPGSQYFVTVQAATRAGYGKPSDRLRIMTSGTKPKVVTSTDKHKPPQTQSKADQSLGIILGVVISIVCITICLCSIYCRRKFGNSRSPRESVQPLKDRVLVRNGNGCCVNRSSASASQQGNVVAGCNEIELTVLCPSSPVTTNPQSDAKGARSNGVLESYAREPLLVPSWEFNSDTKDLSITENPQYKEECSTSSIEQGEEQDLERTQLTTMNYTLDGSNSSMNNNQGCPENGSSPQKTPVMIPVLGPNG